jgi:formylglycine-generating enzyme required for sulfatase activity
VSIPKPFAIGRYQITFEEYDRFASATRRQLPNDQGWGRGRQPAINVSWCDAVEYANWLSEQTGNRYRLPTETEWEYAARAGTETAYWWGNEITPGMANCAGTDNSWDGKQTSPVGSFKPNPFGLYDTAGNVWESVQDSWHENYKGAPTDGSAWEEKDDGQRVIRGGSWVSDPVYLRSSTQSRGIAGNRNYFIGFRLAQDIDEPELVPNVSNVPIVQAPFGRFKVQCSRWYGRLKRFNRYKRSSRSKRLKISEPKT